MTVVSATFDVQCGQRYLIRLSAEQYITNPPDDWRILKILKSGTSGNPDCPLPADGNCSACCGAKPTYDNPIYTANFTGQVAVMSSSFTDRFNSSVGGRVINIVNLDQTPAPTLGGVWNPVSGATPNAFRYGHPQWDAATLGSIFPLTLDNSGNIYTAYCASTNSPQPSSIAGSNSGSIFKIPTGTGIPQLFVNIPDNLVPPVPACGLVLDGCNVNLCPGPVPPGIGDVSYDCNHGGQLFASHFADGRIYRISAAGTPLEAFHHFSNSIQSPARVAGNNYDRFAPWGERVWAVQVHQGRVYYSVWGQTEQSCPAIPDSTTQTPNTIWSVALSSTGAFVPGSRRMELQVMVFPPYSSDPATPYSYPVSDITFGANCRMLLAERPMSENDMVVGAHITRGMEFQHNGTAWVPTFHRGGFGHEIGIQVISAFPPRTNSDGGCAYDNAPLSAARGRVWFTGEQLSGTTGITGVEPAAPILSTSVNIPFEPGYLAGLKGKMGDVEIPCALQNPPCANIREERLIPEIGPTGTPTGCWLYSFRVHNKSGQVVQYMLIPDSDVSPNVVFFNPPLAINGVSNVVQVRICNVTPGTVSFPIILMNINNDVCCNLEHEVEIPDCFAQPALATATCTSSGCNLSVTIQPLNFGVGHVFVSPLTSGITVNPSYQPVVIPQYGSQKVNFGFTGGQIGQQVCFRVFIHTSDLRECCDEVVCVTLTETCPGCPILGGNCDIDFNNDGLFPDTQDIDDLLSAFGGGPCSNDPFCDDIDINNDGLFPDTADLDHFISVFSGAPC